MAALAVGSAVAAAWQVSAPKVATAGPLPVHLPPSFALDGPGANGPLPGEIDPGAATVTAAIPGGRTLTVPILMYHYVLPVNPATRNVLLFNLATSPQLFAQQMALLHAEGANPISLATLAAALAGKRGLPPHPVVLTFDDGYVSFAAAAAPILQRYGFVGTDFVVSGFVGRPGYLSAAQVRAMDAEGMVIGAHTVDHVALASVAPAVARAEIDGSKATLERLLGHPVLDFAYPYGSFDAAVVQMVRDAGFRDAASTIGGDVQTAAGLFQLRRTHIGGALSLAEFAAMAGLPRPTAAIYALVARDAPPPSRSQSGNPQRGPLA